jgi:predicted ribosome quality control (RQC) complex YloA/Tae2 family protein
MKQLSLYDNKLELSLNYYIGENAKENWELIDKSKQNDVWFHVKDHPSAHVVLDMPENTKIKEISKQSLIHCAAECKQHSKLSNNQKLKIIYTEIKHVSKAEEVGSVNIKKEKILIV